MTEAPYSQDLARAVKCRDDGIWTMTTGDLSADAVLLLDEELGKSLAQRPVISGFAGCYTTDVIMILGRALVR